MDENFDMLTANMPDEIKAVARRRTKSERESDLSFVADCVKNGDKRVVIHEKLSAMRSYAVSAAMVDQDCSEVESRWVGTFIKGQTLANLKSRELARLEMLEEEAWKAWQRSKTPGQVEKFGVLDSVPSKEKSVTAVKRDGDPKFLELLLKYSEHRAKLLGLFAPIKIDADAESALKTTEELDDFRNAYIEVLKAQEKAIPMLKNITPPKAD